MGSEHKERNGGLWSTKDKHYLDKIKLEYLGTTDKNFTLEELNQLVMDKKIPTAEYTLEEIGYLCGLSRERIRQIENNAIRRIKCNLIKKQNPKFREDLKELLNYISTSSDNSINEMMLDIHRGFSRGSGNNQN